MFLKRLLALTLFATLAVMPACGLHAQWKQMNAPHQETFTAFSALGPYLFASDGWPSGGIFVSTDSGQNWAPLNLGITDTTLVVALKVSGKNIFAGTWWHGILLSTDSGKSWKGANIGLPDSAIVDAFAVDGTFIFAGVNANGLYGQDGGVYFSTNGGISWNARDTGLSHYARFVTSLTLLGTILFEGPGGYGIFRSMDDGATWQGPEQGAESINTLFTYGADLFAGTIEGGIRMSTDSGNTWSPTTITVPYNTGLNGFAAKDSNLFVSDDTGGIFLTIDTGQSWASVNSGIPGKTWVESLEVYGSFLLAGTDSGIWRRPLSEMNLQKESVAGNSPFEGEFHVFPNPFSQSTQITFTSQAAGYAEVSIVNMLGVEVARLFSGEIGAGEHSFMWGNPTGLPDGTYQSLVRMNGKMETLPIELMH